MYVYMYIHIYSDEKKVPVSSPTAQAGPLLTQSPTAINTPIKGANMYMYVYLYICIGICVYLYMYRCVYVNVFEFMYIFIYTYIYIDGSEKNVPGSEKNVPDSDGVSPIVLNIDGLKQLIYANKEIIILAIILVIIILIFIAR
jgi:hypothetical protein